MSQLLRQLRSSGAITEHAIETALRRQQIYGGSLDTVLLELDLIEPAQLAKQIAAANNCENAPVALVEPGYDRPWDALPKTLLELGWAMPLRRHLGHVQVVVHPEIPADQLEQLEQAIEHLQVFSTCEACLAKLAAERRGSVMPQRYAVLAIKWKQGLAREQPREQPRTESRSEPAAPVAPWMTASTTTAPYTVPPPSELSQTPAPTPTVGKPAEPTSPRSQTFLYGLPVDDDEEAASSSSLPVDDDDEDRTGVPDDDDDDDDDVDVPTRPVNGSHAPAKPVVEPAPAVIDEDAPSPRAVGRAAEPRPTASLTERLAGPRSVLEQATGRDQATDALVRAAMVVSPRVALFGLKKEGLRGLDSPGEIPDMSSQLVELGPNIEAAVEGRAVLDRVTDLDLRIAVGQEMAVPCLFFPVRVQDRPVLMLYVDRNGEEFSAEETAAVNELCAVAGRTLEEVLRRLRSESAAPAATPAATAPAAATPAATTPAATTSAATTPAATTSAATQTPAAATPPKPSLFSPPGSIVPPGAFKPPGGFKPPPTLTPPPSIKPPAKPVATPPPSEQATAAPRERVITPPPVVPPPVRERVITPPPAVAPPPPKPDAAVAAPPEAAVAPSEPAVAPPPPKPEAAVAAPPEPTVPAPPTTVAPPAKALVPPPELTDPLPIPPTPDEPPSKPPVRLKRVDPSTDAGPTALASPLGDSVRGRIVIDDDDDARAKSGAHSEAVDSAIQAAMRGSSSAIQHLRDMGEPAYRRITKQFPGELDVQRRDLDTLPPLPAHGALIRVALELPELGPYLVELIDHPNPTVRFYVAFVFMELRHTRAIAALGDLAFDPDADVRAIAMRVLETYSGELGFAEAVAVIRRELDSPNRTRQLHATRAVGTVRDIAAVPKLIDLLLSKERYIQEASLESLCSITGQQLGLKPHRWRSWYGDNAHHHRVEWIMSSLAHKDLSVRRWASDELRRITGQRINFLAAGTKQEREIGIRKWVEWWNEHGRAEFSRS